MGVFIVILLFRRETILARKIKDMFLSECVLQDVYVCLAHFDLAV